MFRAISSCNVSWLRELADEFANGDRPHNRAALLCLDQVVFRTLPPLKASQADTLVQIRRFYDYLKLLRSLLSESRFLMSNQSMLWLFALQEKDDELLVPPATFLHSCILKRKRASLRTSNEGIFLSKPQAVEAVKSAILNRLREQVFNQQNIYRKMNVFQPLCPSFLLHQRCDTGDRCLKQHLDMVAMDRGWYSQNLQLHLSEILVLQVSFYP
jgi:hypothetical protein